jgi:hypothetical protein
MYLSKFLSNHKLTVNVHSIQGWRESKKESRIKIRKYKTWKACLTTSTGTQLSIGTIAATSISDNLDTPNKAIKELIGCMETFREAKILHLWGLATHNLKNHMPRYPLPKVLWHPSPLQKNPNTSPDTPLTPIPSCHTLKARRKIVRDYNLIPQTHVILLPGQIKKNLAGGILTNRYYAFEYEEKNNAKNKGTFCCDYVCGESFCNLLGIKKLPLFNPLTP